MGYRDVDGGSGLMWIGAFVFGWGCDTYGTGFQGAGRSKTERSGERSSRGEIQSRRLSESLSRADFTLIDSPLGCGTSYAKSCICKLTAVGTG